MHFSLTQFDPVWLQSWGNDAMIDHSFLFLICLHVHTLCVCFPLKWDFSRGFFTVTTGQTKLGSQTPSSAFEKLPIFFRQILHRACVLKNSRGRYPCLYLLHQYVTASKKQKSASMWSSEMQKSNVHWLTFEVFTQLFSSFLGKFLLSLQISLGYYCILNKYLQNVIWKS